jgi:ribonuclease P protein component
MRREHRLRASADYARVRRAGRSWSHPLLVLCAAPTLAADRRTRIGVTVGRWASGAVQRNRARRRVREAVRLRYEEIETGWDLVFVVRAALVDASSGAVTAAVESLLSRAGLLVKEAPCAGSPSA